MMGDSLQSETADRQEELTPVTDTPPCAEQSIANHLRDKYGHDLPALPGPMTRDLVEALTDAGKIIIDKTEFENLLLRAITYGDTQSAIIVEDKRDWRYAGPGQSWSEDHWKPLVAVLMRAMTQPKDTDYE